MFLYNNNKEVCNMEIAYLILAHKNPEQLERLVDRLKCDGTDFFIHIDKKTRPIFNLDKLSEIDNKVNFIESIDIYLGGFSLTKVILNGFKEILKKDKKYDYIVLLSGQDYPIKPNEYIKNFFEKNKGKEFIAYNPIPTVNWISDNYGWDRIEYYYDVDVNMAEGKDYNEVMEARGVKRKFLDGVEPYGGSAWFALTYNCVEYIVDFINKNEHFIQFYKYTKFSHEMLFHTTILNSHFAENVKNINIHYMDWSCNGGNKILREENMVNIYISECLFARRFDIYIDKKILNEIDSTILNR